MIIELESGIRFKLLKVYDGNIVDIQSQVAQLAWMPDFFPIYYSIKLCNYKILSEAERDWAITVLR